MAATLANAENKLDWKYFSFLQAHVLDGTDQTIYRALCLLLSTAMSTASATLRKTLPNTVVAQLGNCTCEWKLLTRPVRVLARGRGGGAKTQRKLYSARQTRLSALVRAPRKKAESLARKWTFE